MKGRRVVEYSGLAPKQGRGSGRPKLWAYSMADLARLFGKPVGTVRQDIRRKKFDPVDLADVVRYWGELVMMAEEREKS